MTPKEQTPSKDKVSSKRRSPKPTAESSDVLAQPQLPPAVIFERARLDPRFLSPRDVQYLQRSIGNRAVGRVLARTGPRLQVQRFPANVLTNSIDWNAQDFNIRRSESGAVAGVQFLRSKQVNPGDTPGIVLKMLTGGEPAASQYGEALLSGAGINVPEGRVVSQGTPEFIQITQKLGLTVNDNGQTLDANGRVVTAFSVMADLSLGGVKSLEDYMKGAKTEQDIDRLVEIVTDDVLLNVVGRLAVYDTAMGNFDRITAVGLNYGNIMVKASDAPETALRVWAIDTAANIPQLEQEILDRVLETGGFDEPRAKGSRLLRDLFDQGVDDLADRFLDGLSKAMVDYLMVKIAGVDIITPEGEAEQNALMEQLQPVKHLADLLEQKIQPRKTAAIPKIRQGYQQGLAHLTHLVSSANKASPHRQALKAGGQTEGVSWETLKAHTKYMGLRAGGMGHEAAADTVAVYAEYRLWKRQYPQRMNTIKTIKPTLLQVPVEGRPGELEKTEKIKRFFTVAWFSEAQKQAKRLKQEARAGRVDPTLEANVQGLAGNPDPNISRRAQKALYLAQLRKFIDDLSTRAGLMGQLHVETRNLHVKSLAPGAGATAQYAGKKLTYMGQRLAAGDAAALRVVYNGIKDAKTGWEAGLSGSERGMTQELGNKYWAFYNSLRQFVLKVRPQENVT